VPFQAQPQPVITFETLPRHFDLYPLSEEELDNIYTAGNYKTLDIALMSICVGVVVSLTVTLQTVEINQPVLAAIYAGVAFAALVGGLYFGFRAVIAWKAAKRQYTALKDKISGRPS
jgi:hypothetical protein